MVLLVVNEILTEEFLNNLVMNLVSFPIQVNLDHFCVPFFSRFSVCLVLMMFRVEGSYLLLYMICFMVLHSRSLLDLFNWLTIHSVKHIIYCSMFMFVWVAVVIRYYGIRCGWLSVHTEGNVFYALMYCDI